MTHAALTRCTRSGTNKNTNNKKHNAAFIRRVASLPGKLHVLASYISLELMNRELLLGDNIFHQIAD